MISPSTAQPPSVPVSWGELIDKVTILEIKSEKLQNAAALANVRHELTLLQAFVAPAVAESSEVAQLKSRLKAINEKLWDIEDRIREKEAAAAFDAEFIELARSVYKTNDERSALKKRINAQLRSEITEEKSYAAY
jgi:hypothetical protein